MCGMNSYVRRARDARANGRHKGCARRVVARHIRLVAASVVALRMPTANIKGPVWTASLERWRQPRAAVKVTRDGVEHHALARAERVPEFVVAMRDTLGQQCTIGQT